MLLKEDILVKIRKCLHLYQIGEFGDKVTFEDSSPKLSLASLENHLNKLKKEKTE